MNASKAASLAENNRKRPFINVKNTLTLVRFNLASRSLFLKRPMCDNGSQNPIMVLSSMGKRRKPGCPGSRPLEFADVAQW